MSGRFTSDFSLLNSSFWVDLLSQRDVSSQVPINFVTRPSIALTAACFGSNQYSGNAGSLCLSRLLTVGYRRILVDIYWSPSNQKWQLCPVSIPANSTADSPLYNLGKYKCSGAFDLTTITDVLHSYFISSNADIDSTLIFVDFNLHAAADVNSPDESAPMVSDSDLPPDSSLLGSVLHNALGPYIYTTEELAKERSNLNESWYHNTHGRTTVAQGYFTTNSNTDQILSTPDGWPCEGYLINKLSTRVIFSRGSIDSQLQGYNVSGDAPYIFSTNYTEHTIDAPATKNVSEAQPICFYNAQATTIENTNNSWAVSSLSDVNFNASNSASRSLQNFSACGISPMINQTLNGHTADIEVDPYRNLSMSTVWSWAVNEPRNESSISGDSQDTGIFRCAVMDPTSEGHWRAGNCSESHFAACRVDKNPYSWMLSNNRQTFYDSSSNACAPNSSFDVPRTGLENTYLWHQVLTSNSPASNEPVWVNWNSIDVRYCWVTGGANATCAYVAESANVARRIVLVPTIAAIIILVITAATIFVKCNSNRRTSRRKRVSEGWDYEGVPS